MKRLAIDVRPGAYTVVRLPADAPLTTMAIAPRMETRF